MIRQYGAHRFQPSLPAIPFTEITPRRRGPCKRGNTVYLRDPNDFGYKYRVGTIPVGTIVYLQDGMRPFGVSRWFSPVFRNPWQVIAWTNREYFPCVQSKPAKTYMAGGHLAVVRSLRDGRTQTVADWLILACIDAGWEKETVRPADKLQEAL